MSHEEGVRLDEVVVTGMNIRSDGFRRIGSSPPIRAKRIITTTIENQTTVNFRVQRPHSIASTGEPRLVDLRQFEIDAVYEYYTVLKIDPDAFSMAHLVGWDQYKLLAGEANLYVQDTYVGRTVLNPKALSDTLSVSLDRDKSIMIKRSSLHEFTRQKPWRQQIGNACISNFAKKQ